jgi:hypothetical protein
MSEHPGFISEDRYNQRVLSRVTPEHQSSLTMLKTGFITALLAVAGILAQSDLDLGEQGGIVAPNYIISARPPANVSLAINTYDVDKRNVTAHSLYGIMHEDISHSGDGGIYAELLINRAFQGENRAQILSTHRN